MEITLRLSDISFEEQELIRKFGVEIDLSGGSWSSLV